MAFLLLPAPRILIPGEDEQEKLGLLDVLGEGYQR